MDVQDLNNIFIAGTYIGPTRAIDHNLYIINDIIYLSNYRAGLRILKINNVANADFTEIGYFDIYPSSDSANFNGAWSVYPYYASGNVVISGIEQGLFVVTPDITATPAPTPAPACNNDGSCDPGEDCNNCPNDCGSKTNGNPNSQYCCDGNVTPDCGNANCVCSATPPPAPAPTPTTPPQCGGNGSSCSSNGDCCSNKCRNGSCKGNRRLLRASVENSFEHDVMME